MTVKNRKIFISHCWKYSKDYEKIREWCESASYFLFSDYSISKNKAFSQLTDKELESELDEQIRQAGIVIAPTGLYMSYSDWAKFEIDTAINYGKPILAIEPWGQERNSDLVASAANKTVGWNQNSLIQGIRDLY